MRALLVALYLVGASAHAAESDMLDRAAAKRHYQEGVRLYEKGKFAEAAKEIEIARAIRPSPAGSASTMGSRSAMSAWSSGSAPRTPTSGTRRRDQGMRRRREIARECYGSAPGACQPRGSLRRLPIGRRR